MCKCLIYVSKIWKKSDIFEYITIFSNPVELELCRYHQCRSVAASPYIFHVLFIVGRFDCCPAYRSTAWNQADDGQVG